MKKTAILLLFATFALMAKAQDAQEILSQAANLIKAGNYAEAATYYLEAKTIVENVLGKDHPSYATFLNNLGALYNRMGNYAEAATYYLEAKTIREKVLGKNHPDYANSLNNLGLSYSNMGNYTEAATYYLEAKAIRDKVPDKNHPDYAILLNNLGLLYKNMGNYTEAATYYLEAKTIEEQVLGKDHPDYAITLNNLGNLYVSLGNYAEAEKYFLEAKIIREQTLGKGHLSYATSLNNLGNLYAVLGNYAEAEKYFLEAKTTREQVLGKNHLDYAISLNNLGSLYDDMGNYAEAEKLLLEAKPVCEQILGKDHPSYATFLNNLGNLYVNLGNYAEAATYWLEAKTIREKALGKDHPDYANSLNNMSFLYFATKNYIRAQIMKIETDRLRMAQVATNLAFLSEQQRSLFWDKNKNSFEAGYSLVSAYPVPSMTTHVFDNTLFTKSLLLRTTNGIRDAIYASGDTELINQYEELGNLRTQISNLQQKEDYNPEEVQTLQDWADQLERAVTQSSRAYRDLKADISMTWQDVQKQLKPDEVAIEFVDFRLYDTKWTDTTMYAALVLRPGMEAPAWIPLCEEKDLQAYFDRAKGALNDNQKTNRLYNIFGAELYSLIWQPLEKELNDVKTVYYSPSGLLHKVAFDAIPVDGARLFDRYEMKLVSSTREVRRLKEEKADTLNNSTVLYGGITYDTDSVSLKNEAARYPQSQQTTAFTVRGSAGAMEPWKTLEGSQREMEQIAAQLNRHQIDNTTFTGFAGNEESFKNLSGKQTNQIIISTHGFFLEDIQKDYTAALIRRLGGGAQKPFENPLLRSGLVMAGGNGVWTGQPPIEGIEDGILTADEISQLNLISTRLVVLSACQTGLGEVQNSEGVFGLQRAFKLAGVESLIMSLWEVDDTATQIMMSVFYENWLGGKTKQEAFRIAQKAVREYADNDYSSPYYWAAFVMMD